jgi:hypothetical protein
MTKRSEPRKFTVKVHYFGHSCNWCHWVDYHHLSGCSVKCVLLHPNSRLLKRLQNPEVVAIPCDPEESRDHRAILLALLMQIGSKLGTANSPNLAGFNTPCAVSRGWIISCRRHGTSCTIKLPTALAVILHALPVYSVSTLGVVCWWQEVHPAQVSGKAREVLWTTNKGVSGDTSTLQGPTVHMNMQQVDWLITTFIVEIQGLNLDSENDFQIFLYSPKFSVNPPLTSRKL